MGELWRVDSRTVSAVNGRRAAPDHRAVGGSDANEPAHERQNEYRSSDRLLSLPPAYGLYNNGYLFPSET